MRAFRIFARNIRDAFISVVRNISLSAASISSITITLLVVSISIILTYNVDHFATLVEKDITIVTFLDKSITPDKILEIRDAINKIDNVDSYVFNSKTQILEEMMQSSETFNNIMKDWTVEDNPLQDTYLVKVTDIKKVNEVAAKIKKIEGVSLVKYGEGIIEKLISTFDMIRQISLAIVASLVIVTTFLISNTIKLTIYSRKTEISIMRLVGASNINIKIPFIFEGLFLGIIGSIIPIIVTMYSYVAIYENFDGQMFSPFIKLVAPRPFIYLVSLILFGISVAVGMLGSWWAVRKHLKA